MGEQITPQQAPLPEDYQKNMAGVDNAARIHQGVSARLFEDLNEFRSSLSPDLIAAFETAFDEIKKVNTLEEAQETLKALFDKVYAAANKLDPGNQQKDRLLQIAQQVAELKIEKTLQKIIANTVIRY